MNILYRSLFLISLCFSLSFSQFNLEPWDSDDAQPAATVAPPLNRLAKFKSRVEAAHAACTTDVKRASLYPMVLNRIDEAAQIITLRPESEESHIAFEKAWYATRASLLQFKQLDMRAREMMLELVVASAIRKLDAVRDSLSDLQATLKKPVFDLKAERLAVQDAVEKGLSDLAGSFVKVAKTSRGTVVTVSDLLFDQGQATLKDDFKKSLNRFADIIKTYPDAQIVVEGHTDNVGNDVMNRKLSIDRANSVKLYLVDKGMNPENIVAAGYGSSRPMVSNDSDANRQKNRRVELIVKSVEMKK
jgi:outer membrane protein OmpA-like peptidoglycan-associated protein